MKRVCLLFGLLLLLVGGQPLMAQDDLTFSGTIRRPDDAEEFTIDVQAGQAIIAQTDALDRDLDTVLTLLDPDGNVLDENDDINADEGNFNSVVLYTAVYDGEYTLVVTAYEGTGDFDLFVTLYPPVPLPTDTFSGVETTYEGSIRDAGDVVDFELDLNRGDVVLIQTQAVAQQLDTILELFSPDGDFLLDNDDANTPASNVNSLLFFEADDSGTYTVSVRAYDDTTGDFFMSIIVAADSANASVYRGSITPDDARQDFVLPLDEGQTLVAHTQSITGDVDTVLTLLAPDGDRLLENDDINTEDGNYNSAITFTVDTPGDYTLQVTSYGGTTGEFLLTVSGTGAPGGGGTVDGGGTSDGGSDTADTPPVAINTTSQSAIYDGSITGRRDSVDFELQLEDGQTVFLETEAQTDDLDTVLTLLDPRGDVVAENDDRNSNTYDSAVAYTITDSGTYTAVVSSYGNTTGDFTLTVTIGGPELIDRLNDTKRVELSGPELTRETQFFIIHYTQQGADAATDDYVDAAAGFLDNAWTLLLDDFGWAQPPGDGGAGGDDRFDVYLVDIFNEDNGCILGYASPEVSADGDNPNTRVVELDAAPSFLVVDNDFDPGDCGGSSKDPLSLLHTTIVHELHHNIQFGYDAGDSHRWIYEATATWMETKGAGDDQDATGYVQELFKYPEICFGSREGNLRYGTYLYMASIASRFGDDIVRTLWENMITLDGFDALDATLQDVDSSIPDSVSWYHLQNFAMDYPLADQFDAEMYIENKIDDTGTWKYTGQGIQELGANFFQVTLNGVYDVSVTDGMLLYALGIRGNDADAFALGDSGTIDTRDYDYFVLMVFNPDYDNNVDDCSYADYDVRVRDGDGDMPRPFHTFDAAVLVRTLR